MRIQKYKKWEYKMVYYYISQLNTSRQTNEFESVKRRTSKLRTTLSWKKNKFWLVAGMCHWIYVNLLNLTMRFLFSTWRVGIRYFSPFSFWQIIKIINIIIIIFKITATTTSIITFIMLYHQHQQTDKLWTPWFMLFCSCEHQIQIILYV